MKIDPNANPRVWWRPTIDSVEGEVRLEVDEPKTQAAEQIFTRAEKIFGTSDSPLQAADRVWQNHAQMVKDAVAEDIISYGVGPHKAAIKNADLEELGALVEALATRLVSVEGQAGAFSQLLDLKIVCQAGHDLAGAYNQRLRSMPARERRSEPLDAHLVDVLDAIQQNVDAKMGKSHFSGLLAGATSTLEKLLRSKTTHSARESVSQAAGWTWGQATKLVGGGLSQLQGAGDTKVSRFVKDAVQNTKALLQKAVPKSVSDAVAQMTDSAKNMVSTMATAQEDAKTPEVLVDRFAKLLPAMSATFDPSADAISLGVLQEASAGLTGASGTELVYNRKAGELQVKALGAMGVRLAVGGTMRAFSRNIYGSPEAIRNAKSRSGLEVGIVCGHLGFYSGSGEKSEGTRGFQTVVSLGFNASVPLLADQSLFTVGEKTVETIKLTEAQATRLEGILKEIPESSKKWTGSLAAAINN